MKNSNEIDPEEQIGMTSYKFKDLPIWAKRAIQESSQWTKKKSQKFLKKKELNLCKEIKEL